MKNKLVHFATHLLLLRSRLFAAALVTASYNRVVGFLYFRVSLHSDTKM